MRMPKEEEAVTGRSGGGSRVAWEEPGVPWGTPWGSTRRRGSGIRAWETAEVAEV